MTNLMMPYSLQKKELILHFASIKGSISFQNLCCFDAVIWQLRHSSQSDHNYAPLVCIIERETNIDDIVYD